MRCPLCEDLTIEPDFNSNDLMTLPSFPNSPPAIFSGIISVNLRSPLSSADITGGGIPAGMGEEIEACVSWFGE